MIDKVKEKKPGKKGLKERVVSVPKQLLRRGLDDGTDRIRGQFRDASQRGQRDDYGGDKIEDAAWTGTRWAERGIERLLKKKRGGREWRSEADPIPSADSPEAELPLEGASPADPPRQGGAADRMRIKTRKVIARRAEEPRRAVRGKFDPAPEKPPYVRTEPPRIKTRDVRCRGPSTFDVHQEAAPLQPRVSQISSPPERAAKKTGFRQQFPDIKTKSACLHRQSIAPTKLPAQEYARGRQEFARERGLEEVVKGAKLRRSKGRNAASTPRISRGEEAAPRSGINWDSASFPTASGKSHIPLARGLEGSGSIKPQAESFTRRTVKRASKEKKAVKVSKPRIKSARQSMKAADRSVKTAQGTARTTAKAQEQTVKAAHATAKAGAAAVREAAKASLAAIKAAIAAVQELIAAFAAGGWVVVVIVLILCMVGLLIASPFGLFFAGAEGTGSGIPQAVAQINGELTARIERIEEDTVYDVLDLDNDAVAAVLDNWSNVLAVYAVRASTDGGSPSGLDGLTAENLALLREVFWDMNPISSFTETVPKGEDDTEIILHITVDVKTPQEMAGEYGFTDEQKGLLEELLKPEYRELFQNLIGSSQDLTLSVEQVREILDSLPDNLSEERRQVILTAYQLLGKVNYFWGGCALFLDNLRGNTQ